MSRIRSQSPTGWWPWSTPRLEAERIKERPSVIRAQREVADLKRAYQKVQERGLSIEAEQGKIGTRLDQLRSEKAENDARLEEIRQRYKAAEQELNYITDQTPTQVIGEQPTIWEKGLVRKVDNETTYNAQFQGEPHRPLEYEPFSGKSMIEPPSLDSDSSGMPEYLVPDGKANSRRPYYRPRAASPKTRVFSHSVRGCGVQCMVPRDPRTGRFISRY